MATPPGQGGISVIRLSGPGVPAIAEAWLGVLPDPRLATLTDFTAADRHIIDRGLAIYFPAPASYTGEHVLELHGHGSPVVMKMMVRRAMELGARLARPGEFSERAFLNGRLDLAQAEAVADLIQSSTEAAARSAMQSLQGEFSARVMALVDELTALRVFVEAALDFPDEEIDFLADAEVMARLGALDDRLAGVLDEARQGRLLRDGLRVVLTGPPNAGKSSLLNALCRQQRAIVSDIPGTTRDVLEQVVELAGMAVELVDTAGIRDSHDEIEAEGVRRALAAQEQADLVLLVVDDSADPETVAREWAGQVTPEVPLRLVRNKIDISGRPAGEDDESVAVSALSGEGLDQLVNAISAVAGRRDAEASPFTARQRHVDALERCLDLLRRGVAQLRDHQAPELLAEDLTACQHCLGEITGEVTSDDLLGLIFGSFCIGK